MVWGNSWDWLLGTEFAWLETDNPNRCQTKKTMRNKRATISFALFVVVIVLNLYFQMHLVRDWSGATVYSRENEAYIFMGDSHAGYHFPYVAYPFLIFREYLHVGTQADDEHSAELVFHVTPTSIDRQVYVPVDLNHSGPHFITPFEDGLYGMCPGGTLCKWTGKSYESATPEQELRVGGIEHLVRGDTGNQPVNGWVIHRTFRPGEQFRAQVGKDIVIVVQNHNKEGSVYQWVTIDLLRADKPPEHLYNVDGRSPRRVTKATYDRLFPPEGARAQATP